MAPLFVYLIPVIIAAVGLLFFVIERPLATTTEGEIRTPSDDTGGGAAQTTASATIAAPENDTTEHSPPPT